MKTRIPFLAAILVGILSAQADPGMSLENNGLWQKNLLRHHLGARSLSPGGTDLDGSISPSELRNARSTARTILVADDPILRNPVAAGSEIRDFRLGIPQPVKRLTFLNHGMEGRVTAFGKIRTGKNRWVEIDSKRLLSDASEVELKFAPIDVTFVRLQFDLQSAGEFAGLGLFGTSLARDYWTILEPSKKASTVFNSESLNYSLTNGTTGARVLRVSSAARKGSVSGILDEDLLTSHLFSKSDRQPSVLIDLGESARIGRISASHSGFSGRLEAVVSADEEAIQSLLESGDNKLATFPNDGHESLKMDSESRDSDMAFHQVGRDGRYILLRWTADSPDEAPFFLRELAVFSMDPPQVPGRGNGKNPIGKNPASGKNGLAGGPGGNGFGSGTGSGSGNSGIPGIPGLQTSGMTENNPTMNSLSPGIPFGPPGGSFSGGGSNPLFPGVGGSPTPGLPSDDGGIIIRPVSF